jgi:uncharacterized LabA/DUF88 family protein
LPDNKVALFIDFDNIRIGIRQHFGGDTRSAEIHPGKLMTKASKYGRVVTAKAYADFTGHPKEFQDKLLFAAGIEPIHAPSKVSGGRRQSSADMHMVIDMFLEAIDHEDVDTIILMSGDADFVRMVATLRRRFGRKVIISGVQSTSTSLDLMNAGDARDPITRADCDMTGELGRMSRPLVTRADLDAQEAAGSAAAANAPAAGGGILQRLFGRRPAPATQQQRSAPATSSSPSSPTFAAPAPPAPRRLRASELRPSGTGRSSSIASTRTSEGASPAAGSVQRDGGRTQAPGRARPQGKELPPVTPGGRPDEVEERIVKEIFEMPPGRMGYTTIKTIEETLRSKAGAMGATRKEIPQRLERLEAMGIFKRSRHARGQGEVEAGELLMDNEVVRELTAGLTKPEAVDRPERAPRQPRMTRAQREEMQAEPVVEEASRLETPSGQSPETPPPSSGETTSANEAEDDGTHFRWVTGVEEARVSEAPAGAEPPAEEPAPAEPAPAKRRATSTRRPPRAAGTEAPAKPRAPRAPRKKATEAEVVAEPPAEATGTPEN